MIAMAVLARRGDEHGETVEEFERGELDDGAPATVGFGEEVAHRWDGACSRLIARVVVPDQAPAGEWGPGAVAQEPLEAGAVVRADAYARVNREAARVVPGAHLLDGVPREQAAIPACGVWLLFGAAMNRMLRAEQSRRVFNATMGAMLACSVVMIVR